MHAAYAPTERKKSVRVVSPARSSPPAEENMIGTPGEARPLASGASTTDSSPLLPSSPLLAGMEGEDNDSAGGSLDSSATVRSDAELKGGSTRRTRTPSPFDPAGPRPSQRNREEERMFAELRGERLEDESLPDADSESLRPSAQCAAAGAEEAGD